MLNLVEPSPRVGKLFSLYKKRLLQSQTWKIIRRFCQLCNLTNYPQHCEGFAHQVSPFMWRLSQKYANFTYILWDLNTPKSLISLFINIHRPRLKRHTLTLFMITHVDQNDVANLVLWADFLLHCGGKDYSCFSNATHTR